MKYIFWLLAAFFLLTNCTPTQSDSETITTSKQENTPEKYDVDSSKGIPEGLIAGSRAPAFSSRAIDGSSFDLYSELQKGPAVVMFYRGSWCPVCNRHMSHFNDSVKYLLNKGVRIVAITPEIRKNANEFAENTSTTFPIISDPTNTIMNAYGVSYVMTDEKVISLQENKNINIAEHNGNDESTLPVPATYVIGQDGYVKYAHFDLNYRKRASVTEILKHIEGN